MNAPLPASPAAQLGPNDKWVINYFTISTVIYSFSYVFSYLDPNSYYGRGTAIFLMAMAVFKAATSPASNSGSGRSTVLLTLLLGLAIFNMVISWNVVETSARWVLWLTTVISLARVVGSSNGTWIGVLIQRLPYLFGVIYISIMVLAHFHTDEETVAGAHHLSGLYGNLILASALFHNHKTRRLCLILAGFIGIYFSGAGGALFTVPIMFIPYILYNTTSAPVRGFAVASMLLLGAVSFYQSDLFSSFLNIKAKSASVGGFAFTGMERLNRSKELRLELVQYGLNLAKANPLGTGLGHTYASDLSVILGVAHVHNGTISMLIELGMPGFALVASLFAWIFWSIMQSPSINQQLKAFYFTYFFTVFGRSLSENYTPFDLANIFTAVFLIYTISLFLYPHLPRREWRPNRLPPPHFARPRMHHPVGVGAPR
ncbi:MAG TPA: O-antigen ligase family protein [Opitutales bacterium]|nr:O-antigen ligase family protein [Opitutales bacterium]